jgi:diguanylate cyclase (GGDEF)-like protein
MRDPLTGILNRRAYEERIKEEVGRTLRYDDHFYLVLIDVDQFKSINDEFGHDVGDSVLVWMGRLLTEHTRSTDTPFRVGGDEFAILAPATRGEVAHHVTQRIVNVLAEARLRRAGNGLRWIRLLPGTRSACGRTLHPGRQRAL